MPIYALVVDSWCHSQQSLDRATALEHWMKVLPIGTIGAKPYIANPATEYTEECERSIFSAGRGLRADEDIAHDICRCRQGDGFDGKEKLALVPEMRIPMGDEAWNLRVLLREEMR
jgi:hypothetical protein